MSQVNRKEYEECKLKVIGSEWLSFDFELIQIRNKNYLFKMQLDLDFPS